LRGLVFGSGFFDVLVPEKLLSQNRHERRDGLIIRS